jgi:hypothetical protein
MPANYSVRPDDRQRIRDVWEQSMEADECRSIDAAEALPLRRSPPQNVDLLAQDEVLCCNRRSRSEQPHQRPPD